MSAKSAQLQIRVSPAQKAALKRRARAAGVDVSTYVLLRVLPPEGDRFAALLRALTDESGRRFALAELNEFLDACPATEFAEAVDRAPGRALPDHTRNYVAAMVEYAAMQKRIAPPSWTRDIDPLSSPWFASSLKSLRLHLLQASPPPFKRRNLFIDSTVGSRV